MNIYGYFAILLVLLAISAIIAWNLSFRVPYDTTNPILWLWSNYHTWMIIFLVIILAIIVVSIVMYTRPGVVTRTEDPINQSGVFLYASAVLLLSNFFIVHESTYRIYDQHPLLFYTTVFYLVMALLTGIVDSGKLLGTRSKKAQMEM